MRPQVGEHCVKDTKEEVALLVHIRNLAGHCQIYALSLPEPSSECSLFFIPLHRVSFSKFQWDVYITRLLNVSALN